MGEPENIEINLCNKIGEISNNFNFLQNLILIMKNELDTIKKGITNDNNFSELSFTAQNQMIRFLDNKDSSCTVSDTCIRLLEGGIYKILRVYSRDGPDEALTLIDKYLKTSNFSSYKKKCNSECLNNAMQIYHTLKELISTKKTEKIKLKEELIALNDDIHFEVGIENKIYDLINPISNVLRIRILINLQNGGKTYTQLEEKMGIKAGHLLFHIDKLIKIGYISQENKLYLLTIKGLKILKYLSLLKDELL